MKKFLPLIFLALPLHAGDIQLVAGNAHHPSLSRDGRLVAYESKLDIYIYDRETKNAERVPRVNARFSNAGPELSGNGNILAFHAYTTGTDVGMGARLADIRILNRRRQTLELVTHPFGDKPQDGEALCPRLASNGRFVLFTSNATNLQSPAKEPLRAAYLFDRYKNLLELVSKKTTGEAADRPVGDPRISQNGRYIFFKTGATNLVGKLPDSHLSSHLYRVDRVENTIMRVDDEDLGFDEERWVTGPYAIDDEGDVVVFVGRDRKVDDFDTRLETTSLFIFDAATTTVQALLPEEYAGKAHSPTLSADGRFVGFGVWPKGLAVFDRELKEIRLVMPAACENPVFSADGRVLAFESNEIDVQPGTRKKITNVYVAPNPFF